MCVGAPPFQRQGCSPRFLHLFLLHTASRRSLSSPRADHTAAPLTPHPTPTQVCRRPSSPRTVNAGVCRHGSWNICCPLTRPPSLRHFVCFRRPPSAPPRRAVLPSVCVRAHIAAVFFFSRTSKHTGSWKFAMAYWRAVVDAAVVEAGRAVWIRGRRRQIFARTHNCHHPRPAPPCTRMCPVMRVVSYAVAWGCIHARGSRDGDRSSSKSLVESPFGALALISKSRHPCLP